MAFASTISNEEVASLEAIRFGGKIEIVESTEHLDRVCQVLSTQSVIGFDTETRPSFKAGVSNKIALMQLSTATRCYLIRLNHIPLARPLIAILQNEHIKKIGADVKNDLSGLSKLRHFTPRGFIDLQNIVGEYGIEDKSLRKISGIVLGKKVSKAQRLSNWEAKQLTPQQQLYAATDAWVCVEIFKALKQHD